MKILFLEPFFGGSHQDFALGLQRYSCHDIELVTLPDNYWKWRIRGAAAYFAEKISRVSSCDLVLATDMLDLADLKALSGKHFPPVILYFHENQLSYPTAPGFKKEYDLGLRNLISAAAADQVVFNSRFHLSDFIRSGRDLISRMPDARPDYLMKRIEKKARVIYPGCLFDDGDEAREGDEKFNGNPDPPLIIWNHRWGYDKNFPAFFDVLSRIKEKNIPFHLALLGEKYDEIIPDEFAAAKERFKDELLVFGYEDSRTQYVSWLKKGGIVVSSAVQENFGIAVAEAVRYGCMPLLPERLSYPELIPAEFHSQVFYRSKKDFQTRLEEMLLNLEKFQETRKMLAGHMQQFSWKQMIKAYDDFFESV